MRVVAALGGNALSPPRGTGSAAEMRAALDLGCQSLAALVVEGVELVLTHGNGPQVGRLLLQQQAALDVAPAMPLDVCVALTQGQVGYLLAQALRDALASRGLSRDVLCVLTQTLVDGRDPAFRRPTKPVGAFVSESDAVVLAAGTGHVYRDLGHGGWRRVVASPVPLAIVEQRGLRALVDAGHLVVAAGGGGVPVVEEGGRLHGVEAVVDKDRTAGLLAEAVGADLLLVLTDVDHVMRHYGTPAQEPVRALSAAEAEEMAAGLPEGSMGPKLAAAAAFARTGGRAVITSLAAAAAGVAGAHGTQVQG